jgi:hypothetical protein
MSEAITPSQQAFNDLFYDDIEHPQDVAVNPLPVGILYVCVSSDFLNAFINYVDIKRAWCLNRYFKLDDAYEGHASVQDPPNSFNWVKLKELVSTKRQAIEILNQVGRPFHGRIDIDFGDDVLIIGKAKTEYGEESNIWLFFWFDRDCSDCCIGRFELKISEDELYLMFDQHAKDAVGKDENEDSDTPTMINMSYFNGWLGSK